MSDAHHFDYLVIGAGSAGCAAAWRLALASDARVALVEAGSAGRHPLIHMPIGFAMLIGEGRYNWNYQSEPEGALQGRRIQAPRGRVLGGSSAINGMVYIRGQREDYDGWAAAGNSGWSYDEVLPLFKRSERHWRGPSRYHGGDGPLHVNPVATRFPVGDAFIAAAAEAGMVRNEDFNAASQAGVGYFDVNIAGGLRHSAARAFLHPRRRPRNLTVITGFEAARIVFDGDRARAVEGSFAGRERSPVQLRASREIVLSAGAFNTPKLLEQSGIGCAARLARLGIAVRADSPQVGENLQDHCNNYLFFAAGQTDTYYRHIRPARAALTLGRYLLQRRGIFANPAALIGAFFRLEGEGRPDTQIHFAAAASRPDASGKLQPTPGICASICQLQPSSRGQSHIRSADHRLPPAIRFNFLSHPDEQRRQLLAVRRLREIFARPAIAPLLDRELPPLAGLHSDEDLLAGIKGSLESVHHPVGTCRMGADDAAVTDPQLRVRGVTGLRIADASIMPRILSGNTHAACVMIGEKVADLLAPGR